MANNIRRLRVAFLLTPRALAARMGADESDILRIESPGYELDDEWIAAAAKAFGVERDAITSADVDFDAVVDRAFLNEPPAAPVCPIATRYGLLMLTAKLAGVKTARSLDDDDLSRAVQQVLTFVEAPKDGAGDETEKISRLTLSLQIAVLAILQARGVEEEPHFAEVLGAGCPQVAQLIEDFSRFGRAQEI
jgi:hypothetical protein